MAKILCIDDESSILSIYEEVIHELMNHDLTTTLDAREALDLALKETYDLIISDYQMPNLTGSQIVNEIRTHGPNKKTPLIFISAYVEDAIKFTKEHENIHFASKPILIDEFMKFVEKMIEP